jgi:transposase InsO family protein
VYRVSQGRACRVAAFRSPPFGTGSTQEPRTALRLRIREIAQARIRYGYRKIRVLLKREGHHAGVQIDFSRPGKPTDDAYVESFNGTLPSECSDARWFSTLAEAEQVIEAWRQEYNESRPHRALGERTPNEIACEFAASREFTSIKTAEDSLSR